MNGWVADVNLLRMVMLCMLFFMIRALALVSVDCSQYVYICAGATQPADEAAGAAAEGEWRNSGEEGDHRVSQGGHGPQLSQTDHKGRAKPHHPGPAA